MTSGTCNGGDRGNTEDRRRRREWLVKTYRADVDILKVTRIGWWGREVTFEVADTDHFDAERNIPSRTVLRDGDTAQRVPACRCYRCGALLSADTVTPDRIIPGCKGGTYRRNNIRPACSRCQSITGNEIKARTRAGA